MKRLILLGNGFDLAHGMKTRYNDFIIWYLANAMEIANTKSEYHDGVISINRGDGSYVSIFTSTIFDYVYYFYEKGNLQEIINDDRIFFSTGGDSLLNPFKIIIHSRFMKSLLLDCTICNWVEIENKYYNTLKDLLHNKNSKTNTTDELAQLNATMGVLTSRLEEYLTTLKPIRAEFAYEQIFTNSILEKEFVHWDRVKYQYLEDTLILNFNYTSTIELYTRSENDAASKFKLNYIHGRLNNSKNPMVFGFGDELDETYKKIEDHKEKGLFKHIKSFWYFKTRNYHELIRYIESGQYQVYILGHSCGLSDRTMLNLIFEHDNCMSIKIYYHKSDEQNNDFTDRTEEISRHFKNKSKMRERIVSFEDSQIMPQAF